MEYWLFRADGMLRGPYATRAGAESGRTDDWSEARLVESPPGRKPRPRAHLPGCPDYRGADCECGGADLSRREAILEAEEKAKRS